jgi:hypothetical protein
MAKKTLIGQLRAAVKGFEKELKKLDAIEAKTRKAWAKANSRFIKAAEDLAGLTIHGTQREAKIKEIIFFWRENSDTLTARRDKARKQRDEAKQRLAAKRNELDRVLEMEKQATRMTDEIVDQVFSLNDRVVAASVDREVYLTEHVFDRLVGSDGKLMTQVTLDHSDGRRRVRAMVNSITIVKADLAAEAMDLIQGFFDQFQTTSMDEPTQALFELTKRILLQKTSFNVGPDLYHFLALDLSEELFPELVQAQRLLKSSIRSEKTNSYIRLTVRKAAEANWQPVRQS